MFRVIASCGRADSRAARKSQKLYLLDDLAGWPKYIYIYTYLLSVNCLWYIYIYVYLCLFHIFQNWLKQNEKFFKKIHTMNDWIWASKIPSKPSVEVAMRQNHRISYPPQSRKIGFEDGQGKTRIKHASKKTTRSDRAWNSQRFLCCLSCWSFWDGWLFVSNKF